MENDGIVNRLLAARALDSVDAIRSFDAALGDLPDVLDETTISDLLLVLDDATLMPQVMFGLVHRIERSALGQEESAVLRVLPRLTVSAPGWARTVVIRLLNAPGPRETLVALGKAATVDECRALLDMLATISATTNPVGRLAERVSAELAQVEADTNGP